MDTLLTINSIAAIIVAAYAVFTFVYLIKTRISFIKLGKQSTGISIKTQLRSTLKQVFGQRKLLRDRKSGMIHLVLFYGFILVQFGAIDVIWKGFNPESKLPLGSFYPVFSFSQEVVALIILLAVYAAFHRRYVEKLERLKRNFKAALVLLFIAALLLSSLIANGALLAYHQEIHASAPVASLISMLLQNGGETLSISVFYLFWWIHLISLLSFLIYIPQSKHAHLIAAPINLLLQKPQPKLAAIDLTDETAESYGVGVIEDFEQKQLVDLYACVECGRCTSVCPASITGKVLSPMTLITKMRDHLTHKGAALTSKQPWVPSVFFQQTTGNQLAIAGIGSFHEELIGDVITEEELWACTTCRNCEDQCPVGNEHVDKIIDMRRYLTLTEGKVDAQAQRAMQNIERQHNPWGINRKERTKWIEQLSVPVPTVSENPQFEYLFWVGSMGSYDTRSQKVVEAVMRLLHHAGVNFAILGNEELNSGDTARRLGNELLFQELATQNIELFQQYDVKKIITIDPHAFHIFKNEYSDFGLEVAIIHHTELLAELLQTGLLSPQFPLDEKITYHDSCYLGRYNNVYEAPRMILQSIPNVTLVEMERNRENAMCCGAGGGLMWMEESVGKRVNLERVEQALDVTPTIIGSGCPYCLTMITDGINSKEASVKSYDVAELLAKAVFGEK